MLSKKINIELNDVTELIPFVDYSDISYYSRPAIQVCVSAGLVKGYTDLTFRPSESTIRAQIANIIAVLIQEFID